MKLFHGCNISIENPQIIINGIYSDFGYRFYCDTVKKLAKRNYLEDYLDKTITSEEFFYFIIIFFLNHIIIK